jgi:putative transposase
MAEIDSSGWGSFSHGWAREPSRIVRQPLDANLLLPWLLKKVSAGETVIVPRLDDLPEEAAVDRESFRRHGTKSNVTIPIFAGSEVVGGVGFATMYREREWPPRVVEQLRLVAEIFGYALERKKRVAEIHRLRDELTHVSRVTTVGQLATSIAHELNQPLAAIMNNTEAAQLLLGSDHPNLEETREALKGVIYDAGRASDIVARFRQLFKRRELRESRLSANELFETVERILRSAATIKNVMLHFSIAPSLPHFAADRILIQQVLLNLLLNDFDSVCATEGPCEIEAVAAPGDPGFVNFAVLDTWCRYRAASHASFVLCTKPGRHLHPWSRRSESSLKPAPRLLALRAATHGDEQVAALINRVLHTKPKGATHWSVRLVAEETGISKSTVGRYFKLFGLQPHRSKSFKLSTDPFFVEKVRDIVSLYLNPPDHALVLCVDEKSQIQALERTQPTLPLGLGYVEGVTHDYFRNGTTTLFAALNVLDGSVITQCKPRHRHQEFLSFLQHLGHNVLTDLDVHLILDNYATHKHPKIKAWLARHPRYHLHFTPTYASWLNQVERWFALITQRAIRRGSFKNVRQLIKQIDDFVTHYNSKTCPFIWTATADSILEKISRICSIIN